MTWRSRASCGLAALVLLIAGCSPDGDRSGPSTTAASPSVSIDADGVQHVQLIENDRYRFEPDRPQVTVGAVQIDFTNQSTTTHSLAFKPGGPPESIPFLDPGTQASISFTVSEPGDYKFFCTFHESLGQSGVLVVSSP